jgi:hypothetical protein
MISLRRIFEEYKYNDTLPSNDQIIALQNSSFSNAFKALYEEREIKAFAFDKLLKEAYSKQGSKKKKKQSTESNYLGISSPFSTKDKQFIGKLYRGTIAYFNLDASKNKKAVIDISAIRQRLLSIITRAGPKKLSPTAKAHLTTVVSDSVNLGQMIFLLGMAAS